MVKQHHWRTSLLLSWSELHLSAGPALLRHWLHWCAGSRLLPAALHLLPAHRVLLALLALLVLLVLFILLVLRRAAGDGCGGRGPLSSEGAQLQAPTAAGQLLLPSIQKRHGAGHQPPRAPPPHRRLKIFPVVIVVSFCVFFLSILWVFFLMK